MTPKERMYAALEGKPLDFYPVFAPYIHLSNADHWEEVTGEPIWKFYEWRHLPPDEHAKRYDQFWQLMPFDVIQPYHGTTQEERDSIKIVHKDNQAFIHDRRDDSYEKVPDNIHLAGSDGAANEERKVFTREDVDRELPVTPADEIIRKGSMDYLMAAVEKYGGDNFIFPGGIVNALFGCTYYVGLTNRMLMYYDEPEFLDYLSKRYLEVNIERIRAYAKAGAYGIRIDDATATSEMISLEMYERFSLPDMKESVREIQRLGMKAIVIYFGGVSDRVEQILSTEPDGFIMEASMKGYVNDIEKIAKQVNGRTCLFGNLNPYDDVELLSEEALFAKMRSQFEAVHPYKRFVTSTGSPLTPGAPVSRFRRYIEMGHTLK